MQEVKNLWGELIETQLELKDLTVGNNYKVNGHGKPMYLRGDSVTITKLGRKNAIVIDPSYPNELFSLQPHMLSKI